MSSHKYVIEVIINLELRIMYYCLFKNKLYDYFGFSALLHAYIIPGVCSSKCTSPTDFYKGSLDRDLGARYMHCLTAYERDERLGSHLESIN